MFDTAAAPEAPDRLAELFQRIESAGSGGDAGLLSALIDEIRPEDPEDGARALKNLHAVEYVLAANEHWREALRTLIASLFASSEQSELFCELGILPNSGFVTELGRRIADRVLPSPYDPTSLLSLLVRLFPRKTDRLWVRAIGDEHWMRLFGTLGLDFLASPGDRHTALEILESIQTLSYRIAAIGLEPELARVLPELRQFESPFVAQHLETQRFIEDYRRALSDGSALRHDHLHVLVLLEQCSQVIARIRRNTPSTGVSIALTYLLQRATETIVRIQDLLAVLDPSPGGHRRSGAVRLFKLFVDAECTKTLLRPHFAKNTELLAREITEHAGRTGDHYITNTREEYRWMFRAAFGAGAIVPILAFIKLWLHGLHAAPLVEGILYGLNYALGFVLIQLLHFTLATKQPAMTATRIAAALDASPGQRPRMDDMVELIVRVCRSQFIAIVGNVALAFPLAFFVCLAWSHATGSHVAPPEKAAHLLQDLHPWRSLALFHAAIAGVYLFLSGLVSGYCDNMTVYRRIPERIRALPWLRRLLGDTRTAAIAEYLGNNLGGLAGNVVFGFMLGLTGVIGFNLGLPLDIRHVTFAAANLGIGLEALQGEPFTATLAWIFLGVATIGVVNLLVSFTLALMLAMKARRVPFRYARLLLLPLAGRLFTRPLDFLRPPRDESVSETSNERSR